MVGSLDGINGDTVASNGLEAGKRPSTTSEKPHPSREELRECQHVKNKLPLSVWFVALLGLAERFAYYGIIVMFRGLPRLS